MPLLALLASDSAIVPVGAMELWWVKPRAHLGQFVHEIWIDFGDLLHITAVAGVQDAAGESGRLP